MLNKSEEVTAGAVGIRLPISCWYVAYTQPKSEQVAADNLIRQGFEAYLPLHPTFQKSKRKSLSGFEPLFPRYIFFKPDAGQSISVARSTRGVAFVLSFGCQPAVLKDEVLATIRDFECRYRLLDVHQLSPFRAGAKVRLTGEDLFGIEGFVTSVSNKRVSILIELLGGYRKMSVKHNQLELV